MGTRPENSTILRPSALSSQSVQISMSVALFLILRLPPLPLHHLHMFLHSYLMGWILRSLICMFLGGSWLISMLLHLRPLLRCLLLKIQLQPQLQFLMSSKPQLVLLELVLNCPIGNANLLRNGGS